MSKSAKTLLRVIQRFSPKRNHAVLWGWPDGEDSVIALEQALQTTAVRRVVLLMTDSKTPLSWTLGPKTRRVKKNSLAGVMEFLLARYVFFTHPCFTRDFPPSVVSVNVWHGMPIKRIGWLLEGDEGVACSHTLATSPFWAEIMGRAMEPRGEVLPIGLPRNDRLFSDRPEVLEKLGLPADRKLLAWLPTYRKSVCGLPRSDGKESGNVFEMPDVDPASLNAFLAERNAFLLVKPHPMAFCGSPQVWSHLVIADDVWLRDHGLSLYQFLGATDCLISDVSSVVIDYLLLDRPVIHAFADREAYESSRGFTVSPIEEFFAGPVANNSHDLLSLIDLILAGNDPGAVQRHKLRNLSHGHRDGDATRRLLESIAVC